MLQGLSGLRVVSFESRRWAEMAELIRNYGGEPIQAPSLREVPLADQHEALAFGEALLAGGHDVLILLTGVGTRMLIVTLSTRWPREDVAVERRAVRIAGIGQGGDTIAVHYRTDLTSFRATQAAADAAYRMAGFGAKRVDVAEGHDAFTPFELISLEDTGLVPPGKAGRATLDGETAIGGRLPVNTSGGLKARGHPLAATGISQLVELCWQLTGRVERRQVEAHAGLAQSIGGLATNNWVTLL